MIHIIALLARAGHGKTTVANYLRDTYGAKIVSLAGPLKRCAKNVMGFSDAQLYGSQAEKEAVDPRYGMSARRFLQLLGTEGLRHEFGPDVHVHALLHSIEEDDARTDTHNVYVVDDTRFTNEVAAIVDSDAHHGACIKVVCTDAPNMAGEHASEAGIDQVPVELIAETVVSSRALGVADLVAKIETTLRHNPKLAPITRALDSLRSTSSTPSGKTA